MITTTVNHPGHRPALIFELGECERRSEQLQIRIGVIPPPAGGEERVEQIAIPDAEKPRAEARIEALEKRCQEILAELWPTAAEQEVPF